MGNKTLIFNPKSANSKHRIPNTIIQVGAAIQGKYNYVFVDGNMESDPWQTISNYFHTGEFKYFCSTVMPGPQLKQAIPYTKKIKELFPNTITIWGGYFASNQYKVCMNSGYVDYIVNGPGDNTFPQLLDVLEGKTDQKLMLIRNLIFRDENGKIIQTVKEALLNQDTLPPYPYQYFNTIYPLERYLAKTFMGQKTLAYHSSMGCPFTCSFCCTHI